jgi:hypothetical protein
MEKKLSEQTCCNCNCNCKKLWVIPVSSGMIIPMFYFDVCKTVYYVSGVSFINALFLIYIFPFIAKYLFTKPLYYEDLIDKYEEKNSINSTKYQNYFMILNSFFTAMLLALFIDYGVFRYHESKLSGFEIIGIMGGIIGLYKKWQLTIGKLLMKGIYKYKIRKNSMKKLNNIIINDDNIEMIVYKSSTP